MNESSFRIQISNNLINQLADDNGKLKKKSKKPKPKLPTESKNPELSHSKVHRKKVSYDADMLKGPPAAGWPLQSPLFLPVTPPHSANAELDAISSVLQESEKVVERLQKQEEIMLEEITQKAKDLHAKEFKLPTQKLMPCLEKYDACLKCYKQHLNDPLKCALFVKDFADCAHRIRQLVNLAYERAN